MKSQLRAKWRMAQGARLWEDVSRIQADGIPRLVHNALYFKAKGADYGADSLSFNSFLAILLAWSYLTIP
jgi:hypothetical protein